MDFKTIDQLNKFLTEDLHKIPNVMAENMYKFDLPSHHKSIIKVSSKSSF